MNKRIQLNEKELKQYIKRLTEEVEDEYYKISPEEYIELMRYGSYHGKAITKMKKFQGKPLWITGDLNLNDTSTFHLWHLPLSRFQEVANMNYYYESLDFLNILNRINNCFFISFRIGL